MAGNKFLPGYNMPVSDKIEIILDHPGPSSYSNVASNSGTGDVITALTLGIGGIEEVVSGALSSDGLDYVRVSYVTDGSGNAVPKVSLRWYVLSTNAEVANTTDLSGKTIRLKIRGV